MPYFSRHDLLFVHIPKNAGTYIETCLGLPEDANYVPAILKFEKQLSEYGYRAARRLFSPQQIEIEQVNREFRFGNCAGSFTCQHVPLSEYKGLRMLNKNQLENCRVLAVHRHPVSRAVSIYQWWGISKYLTFDEFCERWLYDPWANNLTHSQLSHIRTQSSYIEGHDYYGDRFNLIAFENLTTEFDAFCGKFEIQCYKSTKVNESKSLGVEISEKAHSIIAEVYEEDFERFGYAFSLNETA